MRRRARRLRLEPFNGGTNLAGVHIDGVLLESTIELDGDPLPLPTG